MATDVVVVMTHLPGDPHRDASHRFVVDWYGPLGWPFVTESGPGGRAASLNRAIDGLRAGVVVQLDADSIVPLATIRAAVERAAAADGLVVPHDRYLYLTEKATAAVLAGERPVDGLGPADCEEAGPNGVGNVVVFSRATWSRARGYDERLRFADDAAFAYACDAMVAPTRRIAGDVVHLWHPRPAWSRPGSRAYVAEFTLLAQYRDAATEGPHAVQRLVATR